MNLLRCDQISIEFGDNPLLLKADFSLENNERVCLIGRNGTGKSTLMKMLTGELQPDQGTIQYRQGLRVSKLDQELPGDVDRRVFDVVKEGLAHQQQLIDQFQALADRPHDQQTMRDMEDIQARIDAGGGWQVDVQVEKIISQLGLPAGAKLRDLSGGWQRRVALGKALVSNPELLLLDEPTNHLDISTIEWLEHRIRSYPGSVIFITHDRNFLQKLATRIVEIDRGKLISWEGTYDRFLVLKEQANADEDSRNALFDKRLAEEEAWIRQGIKARRTRNEGRVRALQGMRKEYNSRIKRQGKASIQIETAEQSGRRVVEVRSITHGYGGEPLLNNFKFKLMRGDRVGLVGNNGVGKSTLLKILLGHLAPQQGTVKIGTNLQVGYFDQVRSELEQEKSIAENVGNGKEYIQLNGKDRHVIGYLRNFLFSAKRAMTPVKYLSGGECNRVLLAKLFTQPNNFLVLDEPTNDLDVEMLEVLEERLVAYEGTLLIVSHDREFLDNVVTSILVFEEDGSIVQYPGGYSDWLARGRNLKISAEERIAAPLDGVGLAASPTPAVSQSAPLVVAKPKKKLSFKLKHELEQLPEKIELLEAQISELTAQTGSPEFYQMEFSQTQPILDQLSHLQAQLDLAEARWLELEEMN